MVTFNRTSTGIFQVLLNGEPTKYEIFNGSVGIDGRGNNVYGVENKDTGVITWPGALQKAKKSVAQWLTAPTKV